MLSWSIKVEKLEIPMIISGAGNGNRYHYRVTKTSSEGDSVTTLAHGERDVAYDFGLVGRPVPEKFQGPYDTYGRNAANSKFL